MSVKLKKIYFVIVFVLVTLSIVKSSCEEDDNAIQVPIAESELSTVNVSAKVGIPLVLKIAGTPSTGYSWYLDNSTNLKNDGTLIPLNVNSKNRSDCYINNPVPQGWTGGGGHYYFKFNPVDISKSVHLKFIQKRPWMPDIYKTVIVDVEITK